MNEAVVDFQQTYSRMVKLKAAQIKQDLSDIILLAKSEFDCVGFTTTT